MTRIRRVGAELTPLLEMALTIGPMAVLADEFTDEDLELGWELFGDEIMRDCKREHCSRPWGWWVFERGEDPPPLEPGATEIRLAELGEMSDSEYAALEKRAVEAKAQLESGIKYYVATGGGREINYEREAVALYERVREVLGK